MTRRSSDWKAVVNNGHVTGTPVKAAVQAPAVPIADFQ